MITISEQATNQFQQMVSKVKSHLDTTELANDAFQFLSKTIETTTGSLNDIESRLKEHLTIVPNVEYVIAGFAGISQETLASTEEMLSLSENQVKVVNKNQKIAEDLTRYSEKLQNVTNEVYIKA